MSDEVQPQGPEPDEGWLPYEDDSNLDENGNAPPRPRGPIAFIGRGLTREEFAAYVQDFDFGPHLPDFVVLHHTWKPTLADWGSGEAGRSEPEIRAKRLGRLKGVLAHYQTTFPTWRSGPHLYIDDRYIWLFSPMNVEGTHAAWGNVVKRGGRELRSIGVEVIGNYDTSAWPEAVERNVGYTVAVLKQRLRTFEIQYMYPNGNPGRIQKVDASGRPMVNESGSPAWKCRHPDRLTWGGISSHRDYNKHECPGSRITEDYYIRVLQKAWADFNAGAAGFSGDADNRVDLQDTAPRPTPGRYAVVADSANIREGPGRTFPVALGGTARRPHGSVLELDEIIMGERIGDNPWWGHLADATGFVSLTVVKPGPV